MGDLAGAPDDAVALLGERLKPLPVPTAADLDRIVRQLDAGAFADREAATAELDGFGPHAAAGVRERLKAATSPEVKQRLGAYLARHAGDGPSPAVLRLGRAVAVLEAVRTPAANALLATLAAGDPASDLTREAAATAKRQAAK
jgi:hypothetical protein